MLRVSETKDKYQIIWCRLLFGDKIYEKIKGSCLFLWKSSNTLVLLIFSMIFQVLHCKCFSLFRFNFNI